MFPEENLEPVHAALREVTSSKIPERQHPGAEGHVCGSSCYRGGRSEFWFRGLRRRFLTHVSFSRLSAGVQTQPVEAERSESILDPRNGRVEAQAKCLQSLLQLRRLPQKSSANNGVLSENSPAAAFENERQAHFTVSSVTCYQLFALCSILVE